VATLVVVVIVAAVVVIVVVVYVHEHLCVGGRVCNCELTQVCHTNQCSSA